MKLDEISDFDEFIFNSIYTTFPTKFEVDALEQLFRLYSGIKIETILDIGCGYGRHAFELAKRGYHVDGFDLAEKRIKKAQSQSEGNPNFVVGNMLCIPFVGPYNASIALYSTIGSLIDASDFSSFLNTVYSKTTEGGLFIFDYFYPTNLLKSGHYKPNLVLEWKIQDTHIKKESSHRLDLENQLHHEKTKYIATNGKHEKTFHNQETLRYYEPAQIVQLLTSIGFEQIYLYDRSTYKEINNQTTGILIVARK